MKKIFYLLDKFLGGFFLKPKLNKAIKQNLVLPLQGYKCENFSFKKF